MLMILNAFILLKPQSYTFLPDDTAICSIATNPAMATSKIRYNVVEMNYQKLSVCKAKCTEIAFFPIQF